MNYCSNPNVPDCDFTEFSAEPANKATTIMTSVALSNVYKDSFRTGTGSLTLLDETAITFFISVAFRPFHPYFETFNEKIGELTSTGIVQHIYWNIQKLSDNKNDETGPLVLTMEHLEIGFVICCISLTFAAVAFVFEVLVHKIF